MPIRCPKCGYSNDAEFRFCGMCGVPLNRQYDEPVRPKPVPAPQVKETVASSAFDAPTAPVRRVYAEERPLPPLPRSQSQEYEPVNGPSFLGLAPGGTSTESTPQYLFEDDEPNRRGKFLIGLVLLLTIGGGLFWQWQHEGYPWNPAPKPVTSSVGGETTESMPAPSVDSSQLPAAVTPEPAKSESSAAATPEASKPEEKSVDNSSPAAASTATPSPSSDEAKPEPKVAKAVVPPAVIRPKRETVKPAPEPVPDPSEALFIEGQKYLYGSGVPEDCVRARAKLIAAAGQSNAKAQSTVATMYATGHCLPRNLPSAYHWFAMALHNDRDNGRLERDLEVIWSQMTAEEKELALKNR
jgi:zinc-ribbon domain